VQPIAAPEDCTNIKGRTYNYVVYEDGMITDQKRVAAADALVEQYCQGHHEFREIAAMYFPEIGLLAHGCDVSFGKIEGSVLQNVSAQYGGIYCESALFAIYEAAQEAQVADEGYLDGVLERETGTDPELGMRNMTAEEIREAKAILEEVSDRAKRATSLVESGEYYDAAVHLDSAWSLQQYGES
jgi:hypothetical protein